MSGRRASLRRVVPALAAWLLLVPAYSGAAGAPKVSCPTYLADEKAVPYLELLASNRLALEARLGIHRDPFVWASSVGDGLAIWARLKRAYPPLDAVREGVQRAQRDGTPLDPAVEAQVLSDARALLAGPDDRDRMAAVVKALLKVEQLRRYLGRESADAPPVRAEESREPDEQKPSEEPYPGAPDEYEAHNKDTENDSQGPPQPKVVLADVDKPGVAYFRMAVYGLVDGRRNRWVKTPTTAPAQLQVTASPTQILKLRPGSRRGTVLPVLLPQGLLPLTFESGATKVWRDDAGNYLFRTDQAEIEVPLFPQGLAARPLSPPEIELYTAPNDVRLTEWPDKIQEAVRVLQDARAAGRFSGPLGDVELARALAGVIAGEFLYRVDSDAETSAVDLVRKGAFQCDTAATLLVTLLRNEFHIASRPVGGFRGMRRRGVPDHSFVITPAQGHAWVEVADRHGNWHGVDPTPRRKDREKEDGEKEPAEYEENGAESAGDKPGEASLPGQHDGAPPDSPQTPSLSDLVAEVERLQRERQAERRADSPPAPPSGQGEPADASQAPAVQNEEAPATNPLAGIEESNPFTLRFLQRAIVWALDPAVSTKLKAERLQRLKGVLGDDRDGQFPAMKRIKEVLADATMTITGDHPPFDQWLERLLTQPESPNEVVDGLVKAQRHMELTLSMLDREERNALQRLVDAIQRLKRELQSIKHPESEAIRLAIELDENLPGNISRRVVRERFSIREGLGNDVGTLELARAIAEGKLNEFRLASLLGPHTTFVTDPIWKVSRGQRRTWDPSLRHRGRWEVLLTRDPRVGNRVRLYDYMTDEEALARGEMGVLQRRRVVDVPSGLQGSDPDKVTVILIDTSGSMAGERARFQSMYVGALVDRALSEVGSDGRARHRVYIVPFDTEPKTAIEVTDSRQATHVVRNILSVTGNTNGGTDIQKVLLETAALLKRAKESGDRGMSRATVILSSDGEAQLDVPLVREAFQAIGSDTELLMAFVAIGGTNPDLIRLTSQNLGADKSMYVEWNTSDIHKILKASEAPARPLNDFWTDVSWDRLPPNVQGAIAELRREIGRYRGAQAEIASGAPIRRARVAELERRLETPAPGRPERRAGNQFAKLTVFRRLLNEIGPRLSPEDRRRLLDEVIGELKPTEIDAWDHHEAAALYHILRWPAEGFAGERAR